MRHRLDLAGEQRMTQSSDEHHELIEQRERHHEESVALQREMMRQMQEEASAERQMLSQALELNCRKLASFNVFLENLTYSVVDQFSNSKRAANVQDAQRAGVMQPAPCEILHNTPPASTIHDQPGVAQLSSSTPAAFGKQC